MTPDLEPDREVDARGLRCPLPVLRARRALLGMAPGEVLRLLADDPLVAVDLPHFCREAGHEHLGRAALADGEAHLVRRGPGGGAPRP